MFLSTALRNFRTLSWRVHAASSSEKAVLTYSSGNINGRGTEDEDEDEDDFSKKNEDEVRKVVRTLSRKAIARTLSRQEEHQLNRTLSRRSTNVGGLFDLMDMDRDGKISRDQFNSTMGRIGLSELIVLQRSIARSELSRTTAKEAAVEVPFQEENLSKHKTFGVLLRNRFLTTTEVMVSKIFPAGFGWQYSSCIAESTFHLAPDSALFALTTGAGDGIGVFVGHSLYYALKKVSYDQAINLKAQVNTGLLLGTAAFFSGTAWQPTVDALTATTYGFNFAVCGTTATCGLMFFLGLRLGRLLYGERLELEGVAPNNYGNLKADAALSVAIGGATGAFVGTDVSFGDANWLRPFVGIEDSVSNLSGAAIAGTSTAFGFAALQAGQNVVVNDGKNWVD